MFGYRARIGYISPSVVELNGYDFYRIVPDGVGKIAVACMVGGWKEEAYKERSSRSKVARKRSYLVPLGGLLVGVGDPQDCGLVKMFPDNLHSNGQSFHF